MTWKYAANSQNTHAELWPRQNCRTTLLKSHFGTETTPQTRRLVRWPTKDCFWKENGIYEKKQYRYIINLNARYRLNFKYSWDDKYVLVKGKMFDFIQHMHLHWNYFIKGSSRWSAKMWENWKMVFIKVDWSQSICER